MNRSAAEVVPASWEYSRLKFVAPLRNERIAAGGDHPDYLGLENIQSWTGRLIDSSVKQGDATEEDVGLANVFRSGDVLFGKLRPYLAKACHVDRDGMCSTELLVMKPSPNLHPRFLLYSLLTPQLVGAIDSSTFGAKMPRASWDFIGSLPFRFPERAHQEQIAAFLDRETARVDVLIDEKERMLALLEEKRAALISQVVARGLDPKAPLTTSHQEWLGDVPANWRVDRAKNLFAVRDERSDAGAEELLTVSHITGVTRRADKDVNMFEADDKAGYKRCMPGDLAINTLWAWMGAMGISPLEGIVSPDYHVYQSKGPLLPEYIALLCRSRAFVAEVSRWSKGVWSSRLRLYPENFFEMRLPVPPHKEQRAIVQAVEADQRNANALSETLQQSIALAKERRSALISAAVTGQIPLEEMVA
ncbi:restriction endonuclease subunit S [Variovorax beijingensis]|uniref:restriction endonuclease subunit S n=1 Tax=Variovorax beijingensis TaxID=2496117 RepID=UPI0016399FA6|nr:restriction endonuclease subunit S [Variovorax beijingensis]